MLDEHWGYLSDTVKLQQYQKAIAQSLRPGDVVLDLGCGTGILGLLALKAGASRVYGIDETAIIEVARQTFAQAGYAEQSQFFRGNSFEIELPEKVDVVLCDHVGYFGFDYGILELLADARRRFLKPGGVILPSEIRLNLALLSSDKCANSLLAWRNGDVPVEYSWVSNLVCNAKLSMDFNADELISEPVQLGTVSLLEEAQPFMSWSAELRVNRDGQLHGLAGWFDCRLAGDVWMSNSPLIEPKLKRSQVFFSLPEGMPVKAGDMVAARVMARPADNLLAWSLGQSGGAATTQSTWNSLLIDRQALVGASSARMVKLNSRGRARQALLELCDGSRSAADVTVLMRERHSSLFTSDKALERFVNNVLQRDTTSE